MGRRWVFGIRFLVIVFGREKYSCLFLVFCFFWGRRWGEDDWGNGKMMWVERRNSGRVWMGLGGEEGGCESG